MIEEVFVRTGRVAHLHAGGEVIGTTLEHPFFEAERGWVQANELRPGDRIATLSGEWVRVEEVYDTGEWAVVYNLRIADHHTYFVGNEEWGFAVWAHNTYYYPGTSGTGAASILSVGISSAFFEPKKDFGKGFYTTTIESQAIDWASRRPGGTVLRYSVSDADFNSLNKFAFTTTSDPDWKHTVWEGRRGILDTTPLVYDVISGPMLINWEQVAADPDGERATGTGLQTVWLTSRGLGVLQHDPPVKVWENGKAL